MKCQCQDCSNRHVGCHSQCNVYQAFTAERERIRKNRLVYREYDNYKYGIRIHYNNKRNM